MAFSRRAAATGLFTALATFRAIPAQAHMVSPDVGDFYAGLLHPLTSAEHLLPMLALAFLAGQCGKAAARAAIVAFPLALAAGILAGARVPAPWAAFYADALGTVLVGLAILVAPRLQSGRPVTMVAALALGLALGWRGGGDWAASTAGWRFVPGVAATGLAVVAVVAAWLPRLAGGLAGAARLMVGLVVAGLGCCLGLGLLGGAPVAAGLPRLPSLPDVRELEALARTAGERPGLVAAALFGAFAWGAGHALTPGHGKALVGAYLVGARGTPGQAVLLGVIVTVTHTLGVFVLGGAAWLASGALDQERLVPWLSLASGLGVALVGGALCLSRWRGLGQPGEGAPHGHGGLVHSHGGVPHSHGVPHGHGGVPHSHGVPHGHGGLTHSHGGLTHSHGGLTHSHDGLPQDHLPYGHDDVPIGHDGGACDRQTGAPHSHGGLPHGHGQGAPGADRPGWRSLVALGVTGGLVPCPGALVLLLGAMAVGRVGFGLGLVAAFSLGLALVLTAVGLLFLKGARFLEAAPSLGRAARLLPLAGALAVTALGLVLAFEALAGLVGR